jgi:hypothetical protein
VPGTDLDCDGLLAGCLKDRGVRTEPVLGSQRGRPAHRVAFDATVTDRRLEVSVAAGTYLVHVEALDGSGRLVAHACRVRVALRSGELTEATFTLAPYEGPDCDGRL